MHHEIDLTSAPKVVVERRILHGSTDDSLFQKVATVYFGSDEYRVLAPPTATGDSLDWIAHFSVRRPNPESFNSEIVVSGSQRILMIKIVQEELARLRRDENRAVGLNPDGRFYDAQICIKGHVKSYSGVDVARWKFCDKCGAVCIDECPECKMPIRGQVFRRTDRRCQRPAFCHACGHPYPWMEDTLDTARELLDNDDHLSLDERNQLWDLLKYVMSDPKADLAPAKTKLINVKLGKAGAYVRDAVLDLMAKYAAEMSKQ